MLIVSDSELQKVTDKLWKLRTLRRARERVRQLERELYGEWSQPQEAPAVPEFLTPRRPLRVV